VRVASPKGNSPKSGGKFNYFLPLTSQFLILSSPSHMKDRDNVNSLLAFINLVMYHVGEMGNNTATNLG
jgi:hypothetical protein